MAFKFFAGMTNLVEVLNQMWDAFAAGPYNALPLTGGNLTGPISSSSTIIAESYIQTVAALLAQKLRVGFAGADVPQSVIGRQGAQQGEVILSIANCGDFSFISGGTGSSAASALTLGRNLTTGRTMNAGGTINASGADYAEYLIKRSDCGAVVPGQIVGIDADGRLTDKWSLAIAFEVKSTNPSMVGGDTWAAHLGPRPVVPLRHDDDTDAQWADTLAAAQVAQQVFDIELEQARQQVDRIAFAGQVPVNLQGAVPGQFIVPVQDGDGIGALAIDEADITLRQYMRAIGRVIAIEDDGRARIIVKVA